MDSQRPSNDELAGHSVGAWIDLVCERFEVELKKDTAASLEPFLGDDADNKQLLEELLKLEVEYRHKNHLISQSLYHARFPDDTELVDRILAPHLDPAAAFERINRLCDQFTSAWRSKKRPSIEKYLTEVGRNVRPMLLRNLLSLEYAWRERDGKAPSIDEYLQRFPDNAALVRQVLLFSAERSASIAAKAEKKQDDDRA